MPRKKQENRVAGYEDRVHLYEITAKFVAGEAAQRGVSRAVVIRELAQLGFLECSGERRAKYTLTRAVQAAQQEIADHAWARVAGSLGASSAETGAQVAELAAQLQLRCDQLDAEMRLFREGLSDIFTALQHGFGLLWLGLHGLRHGAAGDLPALTTEYRAVYEAGRQEVLQQVQAARARRKKKPDGES